MVFQHFELFPHLSITENLTLAQIKVLNRSKSDAVKRGHKLLDRVGLIAQKNKFPGQLSGGQQQRVAIARRCRWTRSACCSTSRPPRSIRR
jgi:glutamate/aspartate transport system ATP-binding protein